MSVLNKLIAFLIFISFLGCKTNRTINGVKEGVWITKFAIDSINNKLIYSSKEFYKKGIPVKTWKYKLDGKIQRKEKYFKDSTALVTHYYENGKIEKQGKTKTEFKNKQTHWFYNGTWQHFDKKGYLVATTYYENGLAIKTDSVKVN